MDLLAIIRRPTAYSRPVKTLLVMKLTAFFLLTLSLHLSAKVSSQHITLDEKNTSLEKVFKKIKKQTGYDFWYEDKLLENTGKVNIRVSNATLAQVMDLCFSNQPLSWSVVGKIIVIKARKETIDIPAPPPVEIRGKVANEKGEPVPNATVLVKGTNIATQTAENGDFVLNVPDNRKILQVSSVGYESTEINIGSSDNLTVVLKLNVVAGTEVVITGYTGQRRRDITGSVSSVTGKELVTNPANNFAQKMQGKVAGVSITNSAAPGGAVMVRIRGVGSVTGVNDPLYIVDGVPTRGGLTEINPNDIEDIQVLKDASAASIYGSRANNGVIVVTTRKGKTGAVRVNLNAYTGVQKPYNFYDAMTPMQYAQLLWDDAVNQGKDPKNTAYGALGDGSGPVLPDYTIPMVLEGNPLADPANYSRDVNGPGWLVNKFMITGANKAGTDWFRECTRTAPTSSLDLSVSGGSDKGHYLVSGSVYNQGGVLKYTYLDRYSLRVNSDFSISKSIRFGENLQVGYTKSNGVQLYEDYGIMAKIYSASRLQPVYDIMGYFSGSRAQVNPGLAYNPYAALYRNKNNKTQNLRLLGNVFGEADLVKGLTYRISLGYDYSTYNRSEFSPLPLEDRLAAQVATLSVNNSYNINLTLTNLLTYRLNLGEKHQLKVLGGTESIRGSYRNADVTKSGYAFEDVDFQYLSAGSDVVSANGGGSETRLLSYFGKLDYSFNERYLFSATVRRDASSNFAPARRWGTFPAFSAGWIVSDERFMQKQKLVDMLKLRASWGITGNQDIDPNNQYTTFSSSPILSYYDIGGTNNSIVQGFQASRIGNPLAQWEEQAMTNAGIDIALFKSRLYFSADVYKRETRKLLLVVPVASTGGVNIQPATNVGAMENKGVDLTLSYNGNPGRDFKYQVSANWSAYRNKVTKLYNGKDGFIQFDDQRVSTLSRTQQGQPIGMFWGYVNDGIFQNNAKADAYPTQNGDRSLYNQPGRFIFRNTNGDTVVNALDRTFIGSPHPKFTYGLNINLQYKSFDLSVFVQGSYGNKIFNFFKAFTDFFPFNTNPSVRMLDSWTSTNTGAVLPKTNSAAASFESQANSYYIEDGSYLRGKILSLGYTLPARLLSRIKPTNARVYAQGTNLFTITRYNGIDPEVPVQNPGAGADLQYGVDKGIYPFTRTFTVGLQLGF
ncbi:MAG: TonB-dependent receptor [Flavihumibacter sp.]